MARPQKVGLDYFPLDVDIDSDDKIAIIEAQHGIVGFGIVIKLLMKIYRDGYFYEWTKKEQLLFSKRVNVDINEVNAVVNGCVEWGLFDKALYTAHGILTSRGIQRRYLQAASRRQRVEMSSTYLLLDEQEVNAHTNLVIVSNHPNNGDANPQRKEKNSKGKESKEEESAPLTPCQDIRDLWNSTCVSFSKVSSIGATRQKHLRARWEQFGRDIAVFAEAFQRLEASDFCKGENDRGWRASFDWLIQNDLNMTKVLEGKYDNRLKVVRGSGGSWLDRNPDAKDDPFFNKGKRVVGDTG